MLTPPGTTDFLARDRQQHLLGDAESMRLRPPRPSWMGRLRHAVTAITSIIA